MLLSLLITGFPFTFLLTLSHVTGIDPALEHAAATLGARPSARFRHIFLPLLLPGLCMTFGLSFVQAFSVFPSAVLVGEPAGETRVISIAAYHAAFEEYERNPGRILRIAKAGSDILLSWQSAPGARYTIQWRTNWPPATWLDAVPRVTSSLPITVWTDSPPATDPRRYYRLRMDP